MSGTVDADGGVEVRLIGSLPTDFAVDAAGDDVGWGPALDSRLRLHGGLKGGIWRAEAETDLLTGQLAGDTWSLSDLDERGRDANDALTLAGVAPRKALVGARFPWFDAELGLTTAGWGLGMVANDGASDPLFGRTDFGDRSLRLRLATAPFGKSLDDRFPLFVLIAGDRVVSDELASMWAGDVAWQGIAAVLYHDDQQRSAGVYGVLRDQVSAEGDHTRATVADAFADWTLHLTERTDLRLAAEGSAVVGTTDAATSYVAPDGLAVRQGGLAVRTELGHGPWRLLARADLASGDQDPDDARLTDFRFDRDYDVGSVLFDEVLGDIALGTIPLVSDPSLAAQPPDGVSSLADEGAFHSALALQPAATVKPVDWLELRAGGVFAWSTSPIEELYYTFREGGVPTNLQDQPTSGRWLGSEVDWAVAARSQGDGWNGGLELQAGHAFPSAELGVPRVDHVMLVGRITR